MPKKVKIENHLSESEIKKLLKEYKHDFDMYRRLLIIYNVSNGLSIAKASEHLNVCSKTGETWVKNYNANGLDGLKTKYKNCGRKSRMSEENLKDLKNFIDNSEKSYDVADVKIIIEERYGINYSENYVWRLLREKLDYNYGKPFFKYLEQPENAEEDFKKKLKKSI